MDETSKGAEYYAPIEFVAEAGDEGRTLRDVLRKRIGISRRLMVRLKTSEEGLSVNGEKVWPNHKVAEGDIISCVWRRKARKRFCRSRWSWTSCSRMTTCSC